MSQLTSAATDCGLDEFLPSCGREGLPVVAPPVRRRVRLSPQVIASAVRIADFAVLLAVGCLVISFTPPALRHAEGRAGLLLTLLPAWIGWAVMTQAGGASAVSFTSLARQARLVAAAVLSSAASLALVMILLQAPLHTASELALVWLLAAAGLLAVQRMAVAGLVAHWCAQGRLARRVAVVGDPESCGRMVESLSAGSLPPTQVIGIHTCSAVDEADGGDQAVLDSLVRQVRETACDEIDAIIIALPITSSGMAGTLVSRLAGLAGEVFIAVPEPLAACRSIEHIGGVQAGLAAARPLSDFELLQKDIFDRIGAFVLLAVLWPVLLAIAVLVRLDSEGLALYRQKRTGYSGRPFTCLKFRTMRAHRGEGPLLHQTVRDDPRVTRIGGWLRRTSIDELPQLINVLRGDMSLVGPRPHAPNTAADGRLFHEVVREYEHRHRVKPGITGWAQVHGWRGATPDAQSIEQRVRYDLEYIKNWSMRLDLEILLRTFACLLHDPQAF